MTITTKSMLNPLTSFDYDHFAKLMKVSQKLGVEYAESFNTKEAQYIQDETKMDKRLSEEEIERDRRRDEEKIKAELNAIENAKKEEETGWTRKVLMEKLNIAGIKFFTGTKIDKLIELCETNNLIPKKS